MVYDIIIPHYGVSRSIDCVCAHALDSIRRFSKDYRLIFIDNGSDVGCGKVRKTLSLFDAPVEVICNETNLGFVKAVNQGLRRAAADYVVIMNNDAFAVANWLPTLRSGFAVHAKAGAVGPKTTAKHSWQGRTPWVGAPRVLPTDGMLAFFCTMFTRGVIEDVGLLDEDFGVGLGDDSDYCRRMHMAGYRLVFLPELIIPHLHRTTFNEVFGHPQVSEMQLAAQKRFDDKWNQ